MSEKVNFEEWLRDHGVDTKMFLNMVKDVKELREGDPRSWISRAFLWKNSDFYYWENKHTLWFDKIKNLKRDQVEFGFSDI